MTQTQDTWASATLCHSLGYFRNLDSSEFALTLLLETLAIWQEVMLPYFTSKAQTQWGDQWDSECAKLLSENMKLQLLRGGGWDLYRIVSVIVIKPGIFMPNYGELSDCAKEIYRQVFTIFSQMLIST
jgi:hypothetical protein